jgi:hypothetical protein
MLVYSYMKEIHICVTLQVCDEMQHVPLCCKGSGWTYYFSICIMHVANLYALRDRYTIN